MRAHEDALHPTSDLDVRDPLAFDLRQAAANFLGRLALSPSSSTDAAAADGSSSSPPVVPAAHLAVLFAVASGAQPANAALPVLADLLELSHLTQLVAEGFRPLVELLAGLWLDRTRGGRDEWVRRIVAGALLSASIEEIWPILDHLLATSAFTLLPTTAPLASLAPAVLHPLLLAILRLLHLSPSTSLPAHVLPLGARDALRRLFASADPAERAADPATRLLAVRAFCLWEGIPEGPRHTLEEHTLAPAGLGWGQGELEWADGDELVFPSAPLPGGADDNDVRMTSLDGDDDELAQTTVRPKWSRAWVWPVVELKRVQEFSVALKASSAGSLFPAAAAPLAEDEAAAEEPPANQLSTADLPRSVLLVANVFVFRPPPALATAASTVAAAAPVETHIPTATTTAALARLALLTADRSPVLLTSTASSGKTHLVGHLARLCSPLPPLTIALADTSLDPKSLLGNYVSDPQHPGNFVYTPGSLSKAVGEGRWVILEDVDKARGEVLALVGELAEAVGAGARKLGARGKLNVPGKTPVDVHKNFRLVATRSAHLAHASSSSDAGAKKGLFAPPSFLGHQKFTEVHLAPPTRVEVLDILAHRFPVLGEEPAVVPLLVDAWDVVRSGRKATAGSAGVEGRDVGLRDLMKFVGRVEGLLQGPSTSQKRFNHVGQAINPLLQESIFLSALDVFFAALPAPSPALALQVGEVLGLNDERAAWCVGKRRPELVSWGGEGGGVVKGWCVGRSKLEVKVSNQAFYSPAAGRPYALTRPSLLLLEQLTVAIANLEPLLLVGETGTGKTTSVTHLASLLRRPLVSLNLSTQTESADLLGGFKPLDPKLPAAELMSTWVGLFERSFSRKKKTNRAFEDVLRKVVGGAKWARAVEMWRKSRSLAWERLGKQAAGDDEPAEDEFRDKAVDGEPSSPRKRRKIQSADEKDEAERLLREWQAFGAAVDEFDVQHVKTGGRFMFSYVEGPLVKALRNGDWVLLDEVNLASPETLESLASILESATSSVTLTERGDLEPVPRHPDFRLFSCMNPATDVGKKDLPAGLRARFTELYVPSPDRDRDALRAIVEQYIGDAAVADRSAVDDMAELYLATKGLAESRQLADGSNLPPHYSIRTLARALTFAAQIAPNYGLRRALWEGFLMSFTMLLDAKSNAIVRALAEKMILGARNPKAILSQVPSMPAGFTEDDLVRFGHFWLRRGPLPVDPGADYVLTPSVQTKLVDLSRVISTNRFPVLIQGPTSSGKTSAVEYLARRTGHRFVRINNHEHTDIQEYLGTYVSDPETGKLVFQEGVLVRAVRRGDWIVLDELNLAPTDVLEALNRLLDDNRELVIPETQEVVRPHPHFMLFATQNPPGLYGGRKVLSRAFRNRFLEVHFDDVPQAELEQILFERCRIAPSYAKLIVGVFQELQHRRQSARVFETKSSFATLRDLFRWGRRDAGSKEELADHGYMLLAERARRPEDKVVVKEVLEQILKVRIDERKLYDLLSLTEQEVVARLGVPLPAPSADSPIVWTSGMQRLYTLVALSLKYDEPVLMVGETGCGKTSVCQLLSSAYRRHLYEVNCHQNMETADLLGGQKPVRNRAAIQGALLGELPALFERLALPPVLAETPVETVEQALGLLETLTRPGHALPAETVAALRQFTGKLKRSTALFEWHDGPLIQAMAGGELILLDEVSLADDSVLERLNSVLEPARTLVVVEKGGKDVSQMTIVGAPGFEVLATMNPGGDYGKKELSPALRNRFTEIWVPSLDNHDDLLKIVQSSWATETLKPFGERLLEFLRWFAAELGEPSTPVVGVRDILAWVKFSNTAVTELGMTESDAFYQAAHLTLIDGLGTLPQVSSLSSAALRDLKTACITKLHALLQPPKGPEQQAPAVVDTAEAFTIGAFGLPKGPLEDARSNFSLRAPTTLDNAMRVLRGCQLTKPILLEGSPGVGKTSLITALAVATRNHLCRINLSDQTDLADLFGSDLPVENGRPGEFAWKDAAFLTALQSGQWVLLDEMNLASQAVLEGLNAVLDHRGTVYIPELGRSFTRHPKFRIFAAQNPVGQGGGRKGLPKSFLNRFTRVHVQELSPEDLRLICGQLYPDFPSELLERMIAFNSRLHQATMVERSIGRAGSPWEFNLRDVLRWLDLLHTQSGLEYRLAHPIEHLRTIYLHRFRTPEDRAAVLRLFRLFFNESLDLQQKPWVAAGPQHAQVGHALIGRIPTVAAAADNMSLLRSHLSPMEALARCVDSGWLVIVSGSPSSGKSSLIQSFAQLSGRRLRSFAMNSGVDTMELLGSFEQADPSRRAQRIVERLLPLARQASSRVVATDAEWLQLGNQLEAVQALSFDSAADFHARVDAILAGLRPFLDASEELEFKWVQSALAQLSSSGDTTGRFEWVDGELVQALTAGDWLVIDNANLCSASVLDRINSLCETRGTLVLSERGSVDGVAQVLTPHPRFRLFMTLDPRHGELSRAMRNRGVEISLDDLASTSDHQRLSPASRRRVAHADRPAAPSTDATVIDAWTALVPHDSLLAGSLPHDASSILPPSTPSTQGALLHSIAASSKASRAIAQQLLALNASGPDDLASTLIRDLEASTVLSSMSAHLESAAHAATGLPLDFLQSQPIDPMLNAHLFAERNAAHAAASQIVELFVRTRLGALALGASLKGANVKHADDLTALERSFVVSAGRTLQKSLDAVALGVYPVLMAFYDDLAALMRSEVLLDGAVELQPLLVVLSQLADILRQLETVTSHAELDYSSIQVIVLWLARLIDGAAVPRGLESFGPALAGLQSSIAYDAGHGQQEIWLAQLPSRSQQLFQDTVRRLSELLKGVPATHALYHGLRSSALSLAATGALEQLEAGGTEGVSALSREIEQSLAQVQDREAAPGVANRMHKNLLVACGLDVVADALAHGKQSHDKRLRALLAVSESTVPFPLSEMIVVQQALWSTGITAEGSNGAKNLADVWVALAWMDTPEDDDFLAGSADVFRPVVLSAVLDESNPQLLGIKDLPVQDKSLKEIATVLEVRSTTKSPSRHSAMVQLVLSTLSSVLLAFTATWPSDVLARLGSLSEASVTDFAALVRDLESTTHQALKASLQTHLMAPLRALLETRDEPLAALGRCWLGIAMVILQLYIPSIPIDPSAAQRAQLQLLQIEESRLSDELAAHLQAEAAITGNGANLKSAAILPRLDEIRHAIAQLGAMVVERKSDVGLLNAMFHEIHEFFNEVLAPTRMQNLVEALANAPDEQALLRERSAQENIVGFCRRLDQTYRFFADLHRPIVLALGQLRTGLRLLCRDAELKRALQAQQLEADLVPILTAFPTTLGIRTLHAADLPVRFKSHVPAVPTSSLLLLGLAASVYDNGIGITFDSGRVQAVSTLFDQFTHLWLMDCERQAQAEQEAESLYRQRKVEEDVLTDIELEEKEFKELFPQFGDVLDDDDEQDRDLSAQTKDKALKAAFIQPGQAAVALQLHGALFNPKGDVDGQHFYPASREAIVRQVLERCYDALSDNVDDSLAFQVSIVLATVTTGSAQPSFADGRPYDYYTDANPSEMRKAVTLLNRLVARLEDISREWPDQMVLRHLLDRCAAMLALKADSPIVRVIAAFEGLLLHTADWEAYANRDNTLSGFQTDIGNLIVDWRRLELSCWAQLLETQARNFANEVSSWWFKMYEVLLHGGRAAAQEEAEVPESHATEAHAYSLVSLINQFMTTSPLGQFSPRLELLRTFSAHLASLAGTPSAFAGMDRLTRVLQSLTARYGLSEPTVAHSLRIQRDKIEKNVKDFIKLASWKDVNVHALKASAQHTHRQLHRCIRKFREVLRKPCNVLLAPPESQRKPTDGLVRPPPSSSRHDGLVLAIVAPADAAAAPVVANLPRMFDKYQALLAGTVRPAFSAFEQHEVINDAAVEIVTTAKALADETPSVFNDETAKLVKNMLHRKRAAWGTLLKELRKMGFSNRVKAPVLALQQSSVALHSLPGLLLRSDDFAPLTAEVARIEEYHFRMLVSMPELRDSLRSHHTDMTTPDLTKAVGFVESTLAVALANRSSLEESLALFGRLAQYVSRLDQLALAGAGVAVGAVGLEPEGIVLQAGRFLCQLSDALRELLVGRREYQQAVGNPAVTADSLARLDGYLSSARSLGESVARIAASVNSVKLHVLLSNEIDTLKQCEALSAELEADLRQLVVQEPALRHLYKGVLALVSGRPPLAPAAAEADASAADETTVASSEALVRSFLNIAKAAHDAVASAPPVDTDVPTKATATLLERSRMLRLPAIVSHLDQLISAAASPAVSESALKRVAPFAAEYAVLVQDHLFSLASWTGSAFKLAHVLGNLTLSLSRKGFCSPQEGEQDEGGEGDEGQTSEGTGMGAGTGEGNVSDQIEDESQVEGLQDEEPQPKDKDQKKEEGGAVEMSEDFGGELEDVSADGSDAEEDDDDDKDDEDTPPDEQIGDVDPLDENAVDEKFWGDEKGEEDDSKTDEKMDQDHSKDQGKESDLVAKENEQPQKQSGKEEPQPEPQPEDDQANDDEDAPIQDQEADDDEEAEADEQRGPGEKMPDNVPEADTLDLPDELDLDGDDGKEEEDGGADDTPMDDDGPLDDDQAPIDDGPDESKKQDQPQPDDPAGDAEGQEEDLPSETPEDTPAEDENADPSAQAQAEAGEEDAVPEEDEEEPESQVAKPKVESGNDASENPQDTQMDDAGIETGQEEASMDQQDGTKDDAGKQADAPSAERQDDAGDTTQEENASQPPPTSSESKGGEGETVPMDEGADNETEPQQVDEPNPMRNLGDALKEIRKRFEQIQTPTEEDDAQPDADPAMDQGEVEYAQEDDDKDMQALGAAPEDQVQALSDLKIADEEVEGDEIAHMDVDEDKPAPAELPLIVQPPPELDVAEDKALTQSEVRQRGQQKDPEQIDRPLEIEELDAAPLTEEEARALDREVEIKNTEWLQSDRSSSSAEAMWRLYTSVTHDLSHTLCEQLRLILEPTLATRLKGDYRSGKRLNMKKIIPYIASEFTKDKIWLRRTRPSTREYQVLLALDDSRSMAESHSVHLAYSTLALISQAMTKLEVGDIGIAKFGEAFELLHDFEAPTFSDAQGAKVMSQFRFDQKATNVLSLVERSLEVLAEARQRRSATSSTSADIWQLELIISDGICQDHEKLRTLLRKAAEQRVMIVFLIVDSLHRTDTQPAGFAPKAGPEAKSKNSILNMKTAKYEVGPTGQMELTMETYLDTFPFEYYVVLRDVEALPEVLSDTLRQWMERVSEE